MGEINKREQTALKLAVSQRNYRRCRDRALARLANKHKEEYLELYKQEKEKDQKMGKKWLDISGNTNANNSIGR